MKVVGDLQVDGTLNKQGISVPNLNEVNNPNILVNTDGANPVNQRGVADGDAAFQLKYYWDRLKNIL